MDESSSNIWVGHYVLYICHNVCKPRYSSLFYFFHCRITYPNVKAVEKLTSLRNSINFSVGSTNFVKTAETERLAQCIPQPNWDSEHLLFWNVLVQWFIIPVSMSNCFSKLKTCMAPSYVTCIISAWGTTCSLSWLYSFHVHLSFHYVCTIDSLMNELISVLITTLLDQVGLSMQQQIPNTACCGM